MNLVRDVFNLVCLAIAVQFSAMTVAGLVIASRDCASGVEASGSISA